MKNSLKYILFLLLIQTSCVKDVDFDQVTTYEWTPVFNVSFANFAITPIVFFNENGTYTNSISEGIPFDVFTGDPYYDDSIVKIDLEVQVRNEFEKPFNIQIEFFGGNDSIYKLPSLLVRPNEQDFYHLEEIDLVVSPEFKEARFSRITIQFDDVGPTLRFDDQSKFVLKSGLIFYISRQLE